MKLSPGTKVAVLSYYAVTVVGVQTSGVVTASAAEPEVSAQSSPFIRDAASHVNLFVGTTSDGHVFPGANVPRGMVKVGMDTDSPGNHAGYDANPIYNVTGFSQLHDDGTGGSVPLSNFKLFPYASCGVGNNYEECQTTIAGRKVLRKILSDGTPDDAAEPGYFSSNLSTEVRVELTATRRTALHRYTFPEGIKFPRILVDITNDGQRSATDPIMELDEKTGRVKGGASFSASFGPGQYRAFTCVDFKGAGYDLGAPTEFGAWTSNYPVKNTVSITQMYTNFQSEMGALFQFRPNTNGRTSILARVGVSFISVDQACANAEQEIPDFGFEKVRAASRAQWSELLGRIQVDPRGVDPEIVNLLYSSVYRTHLSPADYTGENPHWKSAEPYYDSFYCNWDTYRTMFPLMSLHDPATFARIVRAMIDIQQHEGWIPECRGATLKHYTQGGSNGDPILAEFLVKFQKQAKALSVSSDALYNALLADAEQQPPNWNLHGRQANIWKTLGYIPADVWERSGTNTKQVSRTLEYAFNDFSISQVAKALGKTSDARKYLQRSANFLNVWNGNVTFPGNNDIVGFMQPRFVDGQFNLTDPRHCSIHDPAKATCFLNAQRHDGFYEGSPIVYSQYVPHDTAKLIELQGGDEKFIERLDFMFEEGYFDSTNEPSQHIPFMYHYANKPGLSTQRSRQVIAQFYNTSTSGLPGNDDSGAMGSYVAFYLAGLYPLPATRQFLLSSPYFPQISFRNPVLNTTTTIRANGFKGNPKDGNGGTVFVQSVKIDGKPWRSNCYIDWDAFTRGSLIEVQLTDDINVSCGRGKDAVPPSLSTGGYN
ncbi:glycoside hydrolase family 92 protein [Fomes fomentarius]|nr:glycoside hydrolase family 92 protein [Fomes fomentarius]